MKLTAMRMTKRLALLLGWAVTSSMASPLHAADSTCVYQSRSYSEGAFICVQKSLMQSCTSEGGRMIWKVVVDRELGDRCVASLIRIEPRRRIVHRARVLRPAVTAPVQPASAKCFTFNDKRYCE